MSADTTTKETDMDYFLNARHNEYCPPQARIVFSPDYEGPDSDAFTDAQAALGGGELGEELALSLFPDRAEDAWWQTIVAIREEDAPAAFANLAEQVATSPSGDDDTYDYWPSGCGLLVALAEHMGSASVVDAQTAIRAGLGDRDPDEVGVGHLLEPPIIEKMAQQARERSTDPIRYVATNMAEELDDLSTNDLEFLARIMVHLAQTA